MSDGFTTVTSTSWFSRLFGSFFSVLLGFAFFVVSFPVLFINEGREVTSAAAILSVKDHLQTAEASPVSPALEGKLVVMSSVATTDEVLKDDTFKVEAKAIKLEREVEMYQWKQKTERETRKKTGGSEETIERTTYEKVWDDSVIDSSRFKDNSKKNPEQLPLSSSRQVATKVTFGAFELPSGLIGQMNDFTSRPLTETEIPDDWKERGTLSAGTFYVGQDPQNPQIGDARIAFKEVKPAMVTLLAQQSGNTFVTWKANEYRSYERLFYGKLSPDEIISALTTEKNAWTWGLRGLGFALMSGGLGMMFSPISVLADVLPFLGSIVRMGIGMFAFAVAAFLSLFTIGIAWLFYRPLLAIALFVVAIAILGVCIYFFSRRKPQPTASFAG